LARAEQSVTIADAFTTLLHELDKQIWFMESVLQE
jgi:DNA-binding ferritin-like protein